MAVPRSGTDRGAVPRRRVPHRGGRMFRTGRLRCPATGCSRCPWPGHVRCFGWFASGVPDPAVCGVPRTGWSAVPRSGRFAVSWTGLLAVWRIVRRIPRLSDG